MPIAAHDASQRIVSQHAACQRHFLLYSLSDAWQVEGGKVQVCLRDGIVPALLPLTCTSFSVTQLAHRAVSHSSREPFSQFSQNASPLLFGKEGYPDACHKIKK